jgi:hypothetical protein
MLVWLSTKACTCFCIHGSDTNRGRPGVLPSNLVWYDVTWDRDAKQHVDAERLCVLNLVVSLDKKVCAGQITPAWNY